MIESHEELHDALVATVAAAGPMASAPVVLSGTKERALRAQPGKGWQCAGSMTKALRPHYPHVLDAEGWRYRDCEVISSLGFIKGRLEWHVSIVRVKYTRASPVCSRTKELLRAPDSLVERVKRDFGLTEAEEDNHGPNKFTRSLWLAVDPAHRVECPCKEDEEVERTPIEGGGVYEWREDKDTEDQPPATEEPTP